MTSASIYPACARQAIGPRRSIVLRAGSGPSVTAENRPRAVRGVISHTRAILDAAPASVAPWRPPAGGGWPPLRRKVEAMRPPWLAAADARQPHPAAGPQAEPADALGRIGGARRQMPALPPDQPREAQLVGADQRHAGLRRETPDMGAEIGTFRHHHSADMRSGRPERQPAFSPRRLARRAVRLVGAGLRNLWLARIWLRHIPGQELSAAMPPHCRPRPALAVSLA